MAEAHSTRPESDEETTPPTRSYVDQLLKGNMSPSEISTLRAEISESSEDDEARTILRAPASERSPGMFDGEDDDDDHGGQTAVHVYSPDELAREAELRRRAALRAPISTLPKRGPGSTLPPAPPSGRGEPAIFQSAPPGPRSVPPAPWTPAARTVPPAPPSQSSVPPAARTVPPAPPSQQSVPPSSRKVPPAPPSSRGVPPAPPSSRGAPPAGRSLTQAFLKAIGGNDGILQIAVPPARLTELQLKHEAGFVLSRIDGTTSIEDMLDLSPLGRVETLRILHELLQAGVLRVVARP